MHQPTNDNWIIRKANKNDLDQIIIIERENYTFPWSINSFLNELKYAWSLFYVIEVQKKVVGYICAWLINDEAHINNIAIDRNYQNRKYASFLLSFLIDKLKNIGVSNIFLEVRENNFPAINLYKKFNFLVINKRLKYYQDDTNALMMKLNLEKKNEYSI